MSDDVEIVGRIMDKAAVADRRALFAALQAAVGVCIDAKHEAGRPPQFARIEEALDVGAEYGSPERLAHDAAKRNQP